jgi:hypothetical protein
MSVHLRLYLALFCRCFQAWRDIASFRAEHRRKMKAHRNKHILAKVTFKYYRTTVLLTVIAIYLSLRRGLTVACLQCTRTLLTFRLSTSGWYATKMSERPE